MRDLIGIALCVLVMQSVCLGQQTSVATQEQSASRLKPVGEEAYQVLAHFFQYDRDIPLEAQVVEYGDSMAYVREKIVFRGFRDDQVPGYLGIPKTGLPPYPCILQLHGTGKGNKSIWWERENPSLLTKELLALEFAVLALVLK